MKYYLGIDGGGTKTEYLLIDETGQELARLLTDGSSYKEIGIEQVISKIYNSIMKCLNTEKGILPSTSIGGIVIGLPCYGESRRDDALVIEGLKEKLGTIPFYVTNDVEVGWAGSLGLQPGINVVAGTGSIAFGKNTSNENARSGGWSTFFGDEGSCYWLGKKTMELFSKQEDGRVKKGKLYEILMKELGIADILDFIEMMENEYSVNRSKVASLQKILLKAAKEGDSSAIQLYKSAGDELFLLIHSLAERLDFIGSDFLVSYSGGLFHASEFVVPYLEAMVATLGGKLIQPSYTPVQGAVLLAINMFSEISLSKEFSELKFLKRIEG